jgi:hypothetical protein
MSFLNLAERWHSKSDTEDNDRVGIEEESAEEYAAAGADEEEEVKSDDVENDDEPVSRLGYSNLEGSNSCSGPTKKTAWFGTGFLM